MPGGHRCRFRAVEQVGLGVVVAREQRRLRAQQVSERGHPPIQAGIRTTAASSTPTILTVFASLRDDHAAVRGESPCALDPTVPSGPEPYGGESQICPAPTEATAATPTSVKKLSVKAISAWNKRAVTQGRPGPRGHRADHRLDVCRPGRIRLRSHPVPLYPVPRSGNHHTAGPGRWRRRTGPAGDDQAVRLLDRGVAGAGPGHPRITSGRPLISPDRTRWSGRRAGGPDQPVPAAAHLIPANSTGPDTRPGSGENVTHRRSADSDAEKSPATPSRKPSGGVGINSATVVIGRTASPDFSDLPALRGHRTR